MRPLATLGTFALALILPLAAQASPGVITEASYLVAGPGNRYPNVASVPAGAKVDVVGCTSDYSWCDVTFGPDRGWITGIRLDPGPRASAPIVVFEFGPYWNAHYRDQPFFSERERWEHLRAEQRLKEDENLAR